MRLLSLIALSMAVQACGGGECLDVPTAPAHVVFEDATIGERALQVLRLENTCEAELAVSSSELIGDARFELNDDAAAIPGLGDAPFAVAFTADGYGTHVAELAVTTANGTTTVVVSGTADPDQDGDGVDAYLAGGTDCDDTDPDVVEAREEEVNGRDDDCDGLVDEDFIRAGDIVITEVMISPVAATGQAGQWVEVRNAGSRRVDLSGWTLSGPSGRYTVEPGLQLSGGEYAVLGFEADTSLNGGVELDGLLTGGETALPTQGWFLSLAVEGRAINVLSDKKWPQENGHSVNLDAEVLDPAVATRAESWCVASTVMPNGDFGTPGARNDLCPQFDHDGDGLSVLDGDCDDTDADVNPIAFDVWDGVDNNCDEVVDLVVGAGAAQGIIQGSGIRLGSHVRGTSDSLLIVGTANNSTALYVVPFGNAIGDGIQPIGDVLSGWYEESGTARVGAITSSAPLHDVDGDGDDDVVVLGRPANFYQETTSYDYLWVYDGLPADTMTASGNDDAFLVVRDPLDGNGSDGVEALLDLDLDGDGTADSVFGHGSYKGTVEGFDRVNKGRVWVLDLAGASGRVDPGDLMVASWTGENDFTGLGDSLSGGDVDDDGYDDIIVMDVDPFAAMETDRRVQILSGSADYAADTTVEAASSLMITGLAQRNSQNDQDVQAPLLADLDADGDMDLAIPDPYASSVRIFHDAKNLSGEVAAADADLVLTGTGGFGTHLVLGDPAGDGTLHLLVGAPTNDFRDSSGRAWLFPQSALGGTGTVDTTAATAAFGDDSSASFGAYMALIDVTGDGRDDVVAPDIGLFGFSGGVYLFVAPE